MSKSQTVQWSVSVFVGPGALDGLVLEDGELRVVEGAGGRMQAVLERVFGEQLPASLELLVEEVEAPSVLDSLTERWQGRRRHWVGGYPVQAGRVKTGERELVAFLHWCAQRQTKGAKRALVVLGDVLRAADYYGEGAGGAVGGRPDESTPKSVKITAKDDEDEDAAASTTGTDYVYHPEQQSDGSYTYVADAWDRSSGLSQTYSEAAVEKMVAQGQASYIEDSTSTTSTSTTSTTSRGTGRPSPRASGGQPKPDFGHGAPEPVSRAGRRLGALVEALEATHRRFDLLVTDSVEATVLEELQRLTPYFEHVLATQIHSPLAGWPLVPLLEGLAEQCRAKLPRFDAELLLGSAVEGEGARARRAAFVQAARRAHERIESIADARLVAHVRRLRRAGHDLVALRCAGVDALAQQVDALAERLTALNGKAAFATQVELRRVLEATNAAYDGHSERSDLAGLVAALLDSEGTLPPRWRSALSSLGERVRERLTSRELVLAQIHGRGRERSRDRGALCGLSTHLPLRFDELGSEPAAAVNPRMRPLLDALHYIDARSGQIDAQARAQVDAQRRMHRDMAAFRQSVSARREPACVVAGGRACWSALVYLPADNLRSAAMVETMVELSLYGQWAGEQLQIEALLDRPPTQGAADGEQPSALVHRVAGKRHHVDGTPSWCTEHPNVVAHTGWTDGRAQGTLVLDFRGGLWEHRVGAEGTEKSDEREAAGSWRKLAQLLEPGSFVARAQFEGPKTQWDEDPPVVGDDDHVELRVEIAEPGHAARLRHDFTAGGWHQLHNVEAQGAVNSGDPATLRAFVADALRGDPARHSSLVIRGRADFGGGFSLCHDTSETSFMTIPELAAALRGALAKLGRPRLSLLILEDPNMMSLEVAYELRELAHVLITPTPGSELEGVELLRSLAPLLEPVPWGLEARALRRVELELERAQLQVGHEELRGRWEREVARLAAEELLDVSRYPSLGVVINTWMEDEVRDAALAYNTGRHCEREDCELPRFDARTILAAQMVVGAPPTGRFDDDTLHALFVWQGRLGLEQSGRLDAPSYARMLEVLGLRRSPTSEPDALDDGQLDEATDYNQERLHDRAAVETLQGFIGAKVDGVFGRLTTHALTAWQRRMGLPEDGRLDEDTLAHIMEVVDGGSAGELAELANFSIADLIERHVSGLPALPPPPPPDPFYERKEHPPEVIEQVQRVIDAPVTGTFDLLTAHALSVWQRVVGLWPSGELDDDTLAAVQDFDAALTHNAGIELTRAQYQAMIEVLGLPEQLAEEGVGPRTTLALYLWQGEVGLEQSAALDEPSLARIEEQAGTVPRLQAIDLHLLDRLGRRTDAVCRAALRELGEGEVWESLRFTELRGSDRQPLRALLSNMQGSAAGASVSELLDPYWAGPRSVGAGSVWLGKAPVRAYGRLMVYTKGDPSADYLALEIHQHVRLYALLSSYRLLEQFAHSTHRLWGLVSTGIAFTPPEIRNAQLSRLFGRPIDPRLTDLQFASLASAPLITMALEQARELGEGYELRLTSSESTALLLRQQSRVNARAIDETLAGLDFLLAGRQTTATAWHYLQSLGASLGEDIINHLHERLELERERLCQVHPGQDAHLALAIPRELMRYPWELMLVPAGPQLRGREMLCERYALGRQVWSEHQRRVATNVGRDRKIKALIIGDLDSRAVALPGARAEATAIAALFEEIAAELGSEMDFERERDVFIGATLTREALRRLLREGDYDIVHFAGHGSFSSAHPERSAWVLSDGPLWAAELSKTLAWCPNPPWLMFANACHAAMTSDREASAYQGEVFGLAEACISEGVAAYVAPLWEVSDAPARVLATTLYRELLLRRASIGAALRRARVATRRHCERAAHGGKVDISWASMVLYGNPTDQLFAALGSDLPRGS